LLDYWSNPELRQHSYYPQMPTCPVYRHSASRIRTSSGVLHPIAVPFLIPLKLLCAAVILPSAVTVIFARCNSQAQPQSHSTHIRALVPRVIVHHKAAIKVQPVLLWTGAVSELHSLIERSWDSPGGSVAESAYVEPFPSSRWFSGAAPCSCMPPGLMMPCRCRRYWNLL